MKLPKTVKGYIKLFSQMEKSSWCWDLKDMDKYSAELQDMIKTFDALVCNEFNEIHDKYDIEETERRRKMSHTIVKYLGEEWLIPATDPAMTHDEAQEFVKKLGDGWRLPSLVEIAPLIANQEALKQTQKVLGKNWIWLEDKFSASRAWYVNFDYGYCNLTVVGIYGSYYVRAVRAR